MAGNDVQQKSLKLILHKTRVQLSPFTMSNERKRKGCRCMGEIVNAAKEYVYSILSECCRLAFKLTFNSIMRLSELCPSSIRLHHGRIKSSLGERTRNKQRESILTKSLDIVKM